VSVRGKKGGDGVILGKTAVIVIAGEPLKRRRKESRKSDLPCVGTVGGKGPWESPISPVSLKKPKKIEKQPQRGRGVVKRCLPLCQV